MPAQKSKTIRNLTLLTGSMTTILAAVLLAPALPGMVAEFQDVPNVDLLVRLALTMPSLFMGIGSPIIGVLLDRWGRKPVIIISLVLFGLAGAAGFFLDSLTTILISRALLGLAVAGSTSGFVTLIADYFTGENLNRFMGYQGAFIGLGGVIFQLLSGYLADIGWRYPFLVYLFSFIVLAGVLLAIEEPEIIVQDAEAPDQPERAAIPWRTVSVIYASGFVSMLALFTILVFIPFRLTAVSGVSNFMVGLALALQTLASIGTALLYKRIKSRLSFPAIMALVFLTMGLNHVLISLSGNYTLAVVGLMIGGLGLGIMPANLNVWLASIAPQAMRGRMIAGLTATFSLGQFFTPLLMQPVFIRFGDTNAFRFVGIGVLVIAILFGVSLLRKAPEQAPEAT